MGLQEKINQFAVVHYPLLDKKKFIDAQYSLCNSACHYNSVQAVKTDRADKVLLCWAGGDKGVVHVVNGKGGKYFDETWEGATPFAEYRLIREIKKHEYANIYNILCDTKRTYIQLFASPWEKFKHRKSIHGTI